MTENTDDNPAVELPKTLYYYCNVGGFYGIVKSKEIWLSSGYFTNDYSEHQFLIEKVVKRLESKIDKHNDPLLYFLQNHMVPPYIACFSSKPDLLSQWRGYSDNGNGFAIGLSVAALKQQIETYKVQPISIGLFPVCYDAQEQEAFLDSYLEKFSRAMSAAKQDKDEFGAVMEAYLAVWFIAAASKNHGFHEECEYRILLMPTPRNNESCCSASNDTETSALQFRVANQGIVPYYTFSFPENAVEDIWLGPKNYARENKEALQLFLRANGYDINNINIHLSEVTYR